MQDKESFASHIKNNQQSQSRPAQSSLITLERTQKLDLLIHLISNLRQSLVICGPEGIGKTTLIDVLKEQKQEHWLMLTIKATGNLSLESIQNELFRILKQKDAEYGNQQLSSILPVLEKQNQKLVVIIDDAGALVPGLIASLIQFAALNSCLRLIFSLTNDELHLKNSSDAAIEDCHFIEIPPLTEKQCGLFLQLLSGHPGAIVSFNAINDPMIEKLYRETHGIPGKIISELPKLSNYSAVSGYKWGVAVVVSTLVAIGISIFIYVEPDKKSVIEETKTALVLQKAEVVEISSPIIYPEIKDDIIAPIELAEEDKDVEITSVQPVIKTVEDNDLLSEQSEKMSADAGVQPLQELKQEPLVENKDPEKKLVEKIEKKANETVTKVTDKKVSVPEKEAIPEKVPDSLVSKQKQIQLVEKKVDKAKEANQWVLAQPEKNYTIQLMVLSTQKSALDFLKKNKSLKESLRFYHTDKQGKKKYVLIYGSFKNSAIAAKKMKLLPIKYRKSWVRRFEILQKDIKQ